jgi:hypothetical protein
MEEQHKLVILAGRIDEAQLAEWKLVNDEQYKLQKGQRSVDQGSLTT